MKRKVCGNIKPRVGRRRSFGFSLTEIIVSIAILGILTGTAIFVTNTFVGQSTDAACSSDRAILTAAAESYRRASGLYPGQQSDLVSAGLIPGELSTHVIGSGEVIGVGDCSRDGDPSVEQINILDVPSTTTPTPTTTATTTTTTQPPPAAPLAPTLSGITHSSMSAQWVAVSGATYYRVTVNGAAVSPDPTGTSFNATGLSSSTSYTFTVAACNANGCSSASPAATASTAATPAIVTAGLVMHLDAGNLSSYPGSGTKWTDLSGNGRNATIFGGPVYSSANGGHFVLDGVNDYFNVPLLNSQVVTLSTMLYLEPYPASNSFKYYVIIRQGWSPINFSFYLDNYQYRPYFAGSSASWPSSGYFFSTGSWQHVVATFNWQNNTYKLYVNGNLKVSSTFSAGTYSFASGSITDISRNVQNNNSFIAGKMATFKLYNTELTQEQVTQTYQFYKSRFGI